MATPAKSAKREDKLPLERALRALDDVLNRAEGVFEYENEAIAVERKTVRRKAKKFRKRANSLATFWDCTFESNR